MISPGFSLDTAPKVGASPRTVQRNVCKTAIWPKCILSSHLRRKEIYEARYPETRRGGDRKSEEAVSKRNDFGLISFADDTAAKVGATAGMQMIAEDGRSRRARNHRAGEGAGAAGRTN